jgi:hypothetical protein
MGWGRGSALIFDYGTDTYIERLKKSCLDLLLTSCKMEPHLLLLLSL